MPEGTNPLPPQHIPSFCLALDFQHLGPHPRHTPLRYLSFFKDHFPLFQLPDFSLRTALIRPGRTFLLRFFLASSLLPFLPLDLLPPSPPKTQQCNLIPTGQGIIYRVRRIHFLFLSQFVVPSWNLSIYFQLILGNPPSTQCRQP